MQMFTAVLDTIFPPRPSELVVRETRPNDFSALYNSRIDASCVCLGSYQHPTVQAVELENKFHGNWAASRLLASWVERWLETVDAPVLFVPVPLSARRRRERGYNQVAQVLKAVRSPHMSIDESMLVRTRDTTPQMSLKRTERLKNMAGAFAVRQTPLPGTPHIVLIDDVYTTGATMAAARATLAPHLPPTTTLTCLALARA